MIQSDQYKKEGVKSMTIAFVCPDSFKDYETAEEELLKNEDITKITCATTNACTLAKTFASKYNIEHYRECRGKKIFNLHKIVQSADKIVLFEYSDYDGIKYSRTQKALEHAKKLKKEVQLIEYHRTDKHEQKEVKLQNATWLFEGENDFRHSESRWSTIAQIAFIWMKEQQKALNVYKSTYETGVSEKEWLVQENTLTFDNSNAGNIIVEGRLKPFVFGISDEQWDKKFSRKSPDIIWFDADAIKVIEVKTMGRYRDVKENIFAYRDFVDYLQKNGKKCELYYLLSYGHETHSDWDVLREDNANILLWEELFSKIKNSEIAPYIDENLEKYTEMPEWL